MNRVASSGPAVVLMYHRVYQPKVDPWRLCVTPARFEEHLEVLRRDYHPISLRQLARAVDCNEVQARAVVMSFDDGYADIFSEAAPLLERFDVPGTAFIVSRKLGGGSEFWWDELERIFLMPGTLPPVLEMAAGGAHYRWDLGVDAVYGEESFSRHCGWQPWSPTEATTRQAVFLTVWETFQRLSPADLELAMEHLRAWAGTGHAAGASHRTMTEQEVRALGSRDLVEIGAHTTHHSALSALEPAAQRFEISESKRDLEVIIDRPVTSFAYPFGRKCDYTDETVDLVRQAGFGCACSNFEGLIRGGADRYQLPRLNVGDWDGDVFAQQLAAAFANC